MSRNVVVPLALLCCFALMSTVAGFQWSRANTWRELAYEGTAVATTCREQLKEQVDFCTEDLNRRSKLMNELSVQFCRERVTGCEHFEGLTRRGNGVYECRCRR